MQSLPSGGGMIVVMASLKQVKALIKDQKLKLSIAGINEPKQIVVSGDVKQIGKLEAQLKAKKIRSIPLNVSHAFHSDLMRPMVDEFKQVISGIEFKSPQIKMLSNVTGDDIQESQITPDYWVDHILSAVNFAGCVKSIEKSGCTIYHEIGPDGTLIALFHL
jgi:myxalamid-type polyketide synthase MxaB